MENLDIYILTSIVSTLFVVFSIVVFKEIKTATDNYEPTGKEAGPRANMIRFVGSLFDQSSTKSMTPMAKVTMYGAIKRTISDMESDGVYFPKEVKEKLKEKREELICNYSDLPSVMSYLQEDKFNKK